MCSGRKTFGKRTTLGRGNSWSRSDIRLQTPNFNLTLKLRLLSSNFQVPTLVDCLRLLVHVIHQDVLPERVRRREVRFAFANVGDAADEADQIVVSREHERV